MENFSFWMILLPVVAAGLSWVWLFWARFKGYQKDVKEQEPLEPRPSSPDDLDDGGPPSPWHASLWKEKWRLALILLIAGGVLYLLLFAPPRIGGEIPILPNKAGRPFFSLHWLRDYLHKNDNHIGIAISLVGSIASLLTLVWAQWRRVRFGGELALLLAALTLAGMGQWM